MDDQAKPTKWGDHLLIMTPHVFILIEGLHALKERTPASPPTAVPKARLRPL
jgi:hypothetical protein